MCGLICERQQITRRVQDQQRTSKWARPKKTNVGRQVVTHRFQTRGDGAALPQLQIKQWGGLSQDRSEGMTELRSYRRAETLRLTKAMVQESLQVGIGSLATKNTAHLEKAPGYSEECLQREGK